MSLVVRLFSSSLPSKLFENGHLTMECVLRTTTSCFKTFLPRDSLWEKLKRLLTFSCNSLLALHICRAWKWLLGKFDPIGSQRHWPLAIHAKCSAGEFVKTGGMSMIVPLLFIIPHSTPSLSISFSFCYLNVYNHGKPQSVF